jgi:hypothetical protein
MRKAILALAALAAASSAQAGWFDDCDAQASRNAAAGANGVTRVVIIGRAGYLHIEGRSGAMEVRASGTACASNDSQLRDTNLTATRNGSEIRIEAVVARGDDDGSWFGGGTSPHLDFTVTLPEGIAVDVKDSSGELTISDVGDATVDDSSGSIDIRNVRGNLSVRDSSGEIDISEVSGDVRIPRDSSGSIDIKHVGGSVTIDDDSSGSIDIRDVKRNVTIGDDGSGSIYVSDVGGDFSVASKGSGSISHDGIRGRVNVPSRHRE